VARGFIPVGSRSGPKVFTTAAQPNGAVRRFAESPRHGSPAATGIGLADRSQHPLQQRVAAIQLFKADKLVRFMSLIHAAGAADDGGYACRVE